MSNQALSPAQRRGLYRRLLALVGWLRGHPRIRLGLAGAAVVALVLLLAVGRGRGESVNQAALVVVERGRLVIALTETGTIRAKNNKDIKCEVEGQSTITHIVDEGTQVSKGDLLVELDSGDLETKLTAQKMRYEDAKAANERAIADLDITKSRNESNIKKAEQGLKFAHMDLDKWRGSAQAEGPQQEASGAGDEAERTEPPTELGSYQELCEMAGLELDGGEGELFKERREALSDISLAQGQLRQAQTRLKGTTELHARKYATKEELEADILIEQRRKAELAVAMLNRQLFEQYDWPRELDTRQSAVEEAQRELDRANSEAKANLAQARAELLKREAQLELQGDEMAKVEEQVANTKVEAPQAGLVVYPRVSHWRGQEQLLEVGAQVRHRQVLVQLPDLSELVIDTKVYESDVSKLQVGQKARIKVHALAQALGAGNAATLQGEVTKIAILPDAASRWLNPDQRVFNVEVSVGETREDIVSRLKPEMTAEVTIILATLENCLHVPVQAVTKAGDQNVAYVVQRGEARMVPVTVGLSNTVRTQILSGLEVGDEVLLAPPLGGGGGHLALGLPGTEEVEAPSAESADGTQAGPREAGSTDTTEADAAQTEQPPAERPSAEQMEQLRRRRQDASPEERQRMRDQYRQREGGRQAPQAGQRRRGARPGGGE